MVTQANFVASTALLTPSESPKKLPREERCVRCRSMEDTARAVSCFGQGWISVAVIHKKNKREKTLVRKLSSEPEEVGLPKGCVCMGG